MVTQYCIIIIQADAGTVQTPGTHITHVHTSISDMNTHHTCTHIIHVHTSYMYTHHTCTHITHVHTSYMYTHIIHVLLY